MRDFSNLEIGNPYRRLLFKRGYLASCSALPVVHPHWRVWSSGGLHITCDPDLPFSARADERTLLVILGTVVSLNHDSVDHGELTDALFAALSQSEDSFFAELDACCGRFVCFYSKNGAIRVMGDACGMKMIHYATDPHWAVASHAYLLAAYLGKEKSAACAAFLSEARPAQYNMAFLPGHATTYEGVRILPPNTYLDTDTGRIRRFFPRERLPARTHDDAVDRACRIAADLMNKFARLSPLAVSLTAGLDSRLTTAAAHRVHDQAVFFTYVRRQERVNIVDAVIAERLAQSNGLRQANIFFNYEMSEADDDFEDFKQFREIASYCVEFEHFLPLAYTYLKTWPEGKLHVRSNIGEICRAYYHGASFDRLVRKGSLLDQLVSLYEMRVQCSSHEFSCQETARYIAETDIPDALHGYDERALYYWEHITSVWHGSLLLESDFAHDTVCLYNCRELLSAFLSAPFESQISKQAMLDVIRRLWPSLLAEPINPPYNQVSPEETLRFGAYAPTAKAGA